MKKLDDEELQRLFVDRHFSSKEPLSKDEKAYHTLFDALKSEPQGGLPYDFAAKVTRRIQAGQQRGNELRLNLIAACLFLLALSITCSVLAMFSPGSTPVLLKYKWILLSLPLIFVGIQYFDQKLIKTRMFRNNANN